MLRGFVSAFFLRSSGAATNFLLTILLANVLGAANTGLYLIVSTIVLIISTLGRYGMDTILLQKVGASFGSDNLSGAKSFYIKAISISFLASILFSLVGCLLYYFFFKVEEMSTHETFLALLLILLSPLVTVSFVNAQCLKGCQRFNKCVLIENVITPSIVSVGILLFGNEFSLLSAFYAYLFSIVINFSLSVYWWNINLYREISVEERESFYPLNELLSRGRDVFLAVLAKLAGAWAPLLFLGLAFESHDVGLFGTAIRFSGLITFVVMAVNTVSAPNMASCYGRDDLEGLKKVFTTTLLITTFFAGVFLALVVFFGEELLLYLSQDFSGGGVILIALSSGQFFSVLVGPCTYALLMTNNEKHYKEIMLLASLTCVISLAVFVPAIGLYGAVVSVILYNIVENYGCAYKCKKLTGISTLSLFR